MKTTIFILALFLSLTISCKKDKSEPEQMPCTDFEGYSYKTVKIGNQWWMAENLRTIHYRNGKLINNDDLKNDSIYGKLYNFFAVVDTNNIAPVGWHVPTNAEWDTLTTYLGGKPNLINAHSVLDSLHAYVKVDSIAGSKMREIGTKHWNSPNISNNSSGFTALPGGYSSSGTILLVGTDARWWSSTEDENDLALARDLDNFTFTEIVDLKYQGYSVRCVKD